MFEDKLNLKITVDEEINVIVTKTPHVPNTTDFPTRDTKVCTDDFINLIPKLQPTKQCVQKLEKP